MSLAAANYATAARNAMSPRDVEASALLKAAARLQEAARSALPGSPDFDAALTHNRRLWTVIAGSITDPETHLPEPLRSQLETLANFVFNHTLAVTVAPAAEKLACLIAINRELAAGLRSHPQP